MVSPSAPVLYPGEKLDTVAGFPTLWNLIRSPHPDATKPLLVFVPGALHNARIAYGGHRGGRKEDFIAHWATQSGFHLLAISYPLESNPTLMPAIAPTFGTPDWGRQAAEVTYQVINAENLSKHIVYLAWSLSGKTMEPYTKEATSLGLTVDLAISLAATPALTVLRGSSPPQFERTEVGYTTSAKVFAHFMDHIREQSLLDGNRLIIDEKSFMSDYLGGMPDGLRPWGLRYDLASKTFIEDQLAAAARPDFGALPLIASITGTSAMDLRHAIADKATWGFMLTYKLLADVHAATRAARSSATMDPVIWQKLLDLVHSAPELLSTSIPGNHFFFVGESGARATVDTVVGFIEKAEVLRANMATVLHDLYK